jgi:5-methylcytosine-specific restriction endonuclease McrA
MRVTPSLRPVEPPLSPSRRDVLQRWEELDEWSCAYCDVPFTQMVVAEVDHIHPLAKGGLHDFHNFAPSCAPCNRAKGDTDVVTWLTKSAGESLTVDAPTVT